MSIETLLAELTAAVKENTAAVLAAASAAPTVATGAAEQTTEKSGRKGKGAAAAVETKKEEPAGPKHTLDEVTAAIVKIKEDFGMAEAKSLVQSLGYAKMAEIKPEDFDKAFDAAEKKYAELSEEAV